MAQYTLTEAAKATGRSKSTILRSIRAGRISAVRNELTGGWLVEPVELHRLYAERDAERAAPDDTPRNGHDAGHWARLVTEQAETIRDLRARLDVADARLDRLTIMLTDRRPWWRRMIG